MDVLLENDRIFAFRLFTNYNRLVQDKHGRNLKETMRDANDIESDGLMLADKVDKVVQATRCTHQMSPWFISGYRNPHQLCLPNE